MEENLNGIKQMNTKADQILEKILELKVGQTEVKVDIKGIHEHLKRLNGTVAEHEKKIGNIRLQMAKWLGGAAVLVVFAQLVLHFLA